MGRAISNDRKKLRLLYLFFISLQSSFKRGEKMTEFPGDHIGDGKKSREGIQSARQEEGADHKVNNR